MERSLFHMGKGADVKKVIKALAFCATVLACPLSAWADFSGPYAPANWTTTLTGTPPAGGGSVDASGAPAAITLNGGNVDCTSGTGTCLLDFTIAVPAAGTVSFDWAYQTTDSGGSFWDLFLVLDNGTALQLSDDAGADTQTGSYSFAVTAGQVVGFRLDCTDCTSGAATVTISNFSGPLAAPPAAAVQPVPTLEFYGLAGLMALLGWVGASRLRRQRAR